MSLPTQISVLKKSLDNLLFEKERLGCRSIWNDLFSRLENLKVNQAPIQACLSAIAARWEKSRLVISAEAPEAVHRHVPGSKCSLRMQVRAMVLPSVGDGHALVTSPTSLPSWVNFSQGTDPGNSGVRQRRQQSCKGTVGKYSEHHVSC